MTKSIQTINFNDTFLSMDHLKMSFPQYEIECDEDNAVWTPEVAQEATEKVKSHPNRSEIAGLEAGCYDKSTLMSDIVNVANIITENVPLTINSEGNVTITYDYLKTTILEEKVPVSLSLVAVMGLPQSGKSHVIQTVFKNSIHLKKQVVLGKDIFDKHMLRQYDSRGLSVYGLCVLGGQPYNNYAWSFTTRRYGVTASILSSVIRQLGLERIELSKVRFDDTPSNPFKHEILDRHLWWVFGAAKNHIKDIAEEPKKVNLLAAGISLVNVFDVGVNKAVYDFLPYLAISCKNLVRLVFLSMENDANNLYTPPNLDYDRYKERRDHEVVMRWRPRMNYLMHFASLGSKPKHKGSKTVFIGTWNRGSPEGDDKDSSSNEVNPQSTEFLKMKETIAARQGTITEDEHWLEVYIKSERSLLAGNRVIENLVAKNSDFKLDMPLKWIFLRSLVSSYKQHATAVQDKEAPIIVSSDLIRQLAKMCNMENEEIEIFLTTFTDFGSILYVPQFKSLKKHVIVDIYQFTQLLSELYYPTNSSSLDSNILHAKYGILTAEKISDILKGVDQSVFMEIVTELGMTAQISESSKIDVSEITVPLGVHYYIPSARTTPVRSNEKHYESAYIHIESVNFPANVQACLAHAIINNVTDAIIVASEVSNVTTFRFQQTSAKVEVIYRGSKTELQLVNDTPHLDERIVTILSEILTACCEALTKKQNQIRYLWFNIGFRCKRKDEFHYLYCDKKLDLPNECCECWPSSETSQLQFWIEAAKHCKLLNFENELRLKKAVKLTMKEMMIVAEELEEINTEDLEKVCVQLDVDKDKWEALKVEHQGWRLVVKLLFLWEERMQEKKIIPSKQHLAKIFKELKYERLSTKLNTFSV